MTGKAEFQGRLTRHPCGVFLDSQALFLLFHLRCCFESIKSQSREELRTKAGFSLSLAVSGQPV